MRGKREKRKEKREKRKEKREKRKEKREKEGGDYRAKDITEQ